LRSNSDGMNPAERILCERVACLLPALGAESDGVSFDPE
jgi:hypothetical protein